MDIRGPALALLALCLPALSPSAARAFQSEDDFETEAQLSAEELETLQSAPDDPACVANDPKLQQHVSGLLQGKGRWAFEFVLLKPDGSAEVLSQLNPYRPMIPASTMKVFTGWFGFIRAAKPLSYLSQMLHHSVNTMAAAVLRAAGGAPAMRGFLSALGLPVSDGFVLADGSGLSAQNRVTARLEVELLQSILKAPEYDKFKVLLAQPGAPGTLGSRLLEYRGSLYAKTGTLMKTGVVALTGFLETPEGTVVFAVIGNNVTQPIPAERAVIDEVVRAHGTYLAGRRASSLDVARLTRFSESLAPRFQ